MGKPRNSKKSTPTKRNNNRTFSPSPNNCAAKPTKKKKTEGPRNRKRSASRNAPSTRRKKGKRQASKSKSKPKKNSSSSCSSSTSKKSSSTGKPCDSSPSAIKSSCSKSSPSTSDHTRDLGSVIKSPLDSHNYKVARLEKNGLEGFLISTCNHELDLGSPNDSRNKGDCVFSKIVEFNKKYGNFDTKTNTNSENVDDAPCRKFSDATEKIQKTTKEWRQKVKCRRGVPVLDDMMQDARNNLCSVVLLVKAGMFLDPPDVQGMAHFCEHAIFLGSENYPETEGFQKFIDGNGGYSNARTDPESTTYMFNIHISEIRTALDMFVDMIANPIFDNNAILQEMDLLSSEFEIKRLNEDHRFLALLQLCAMDQHPASNFGMGTKETLLKHSNILEKLRAWKNKYYTAENMLFALQGPYPLEELETIFIEFGSKLPGRDSRASIESPLSTLENFIGKPSFDMEKWNKFYHIVPIANTKFMYISWVLDPKFGNNYETKPVHYLIYILDHKTPGSLEWYLRKRGWILSICLTCPSFNFMITRLHTIFNLTLELTSDGLENRLEVVRTVFSYINMLRQRKASSQKFDEIRQIHTDIFHYRSDKNLIDPTIGYFFDPDSCLDCLRELLETMSIVQPPGEVLLSRFMLRKYDSQLLNEFMDFFTPKNVLIIFAGKCFEEDADELQQMYKVRYYTRPMCPELLQELENIVPLAEFNFPSENPFTKISMCFPEKPNETIENRTDLKIYKSEKGQVIYGNVECRKGLLPSAEYTFWFNSPVIEDDGDLRVVPSMDIFKRMMCHNLDIELANALNSLTSYDLYSASAVLIIEIRGPSPKLPQLAEIVLNTVQNFDKFVKEHYILFDDIRRNQIDLYKSDLCDSEKCAMLFKQYLLLQQCLFVSDFAQFLNSFTVEDFLGFVQDFKSRMNVRADLDGCVSKSHASAVAKVLDSLMYKPYMRKLEHVSINRALQLPSGERCLLACAKLKENRTIFVLNFYQLGFLNKNEDVMLKVIKEGIEDIVFEELRTKEHLGYMVESGIDDVCGTSGISIIVYGQADKHSCGYINEQIDIFMNTACNRLLSSQDKYKNNLERYLQHGEKINWKDTKAFFQKYFLSTGDEFRKLSIQIQGHKLAKAQPEKPSLVAEKVKHFTSGKIASTHAGISRISYYLDLLLKDVEEENGYFITDVYKFKNNLSCFGNMQSYDIFASDLIEDDD